MKKHPGFLDLLFRTGILLFFSFGLSLTIPSSVAAQLVRPERPPQSRPARLNVQFHRAQSAWRNGSSLLEAKARIDRVLREIPMDLEARKLRAGIFLSMENPQKALLDARAAARIEPDDGEAHLLICEAGVQTGDRVQARKALNRSAERLLDRSTFHVRLSRCAMALGQVEAAEAYARTALAGNSKNGDAYLQLARVFLAMDTTENAITVLQRGIDAHVLNRSVIRQDTSLSKLMDEL